MSRLVTLTRPRQHQQLEISRGGSEYQVTLAVVGKRYHQLFYAYGQRIRLSAINGNFGLWVDDGTLHSSGVCTDVSEAEAREIAERCGVPMPEPVSPQAEGSQA